MDVLHDERMDGFGERKTPEPFVAACDKFIYKEILRTESAAAKASKPEEDGPALPALQPVVLAALDAVAREDGWAPLGPVGSQMNKNHPSIDPSNYGFSQLSKLMRKQDYLEIKEVAGVAQVFKCLVHAVAPRCLSAIFWAAAKRA